MGTPVVTLPGQFLRSRITQALYRRVGVTDTVVGSPDEFVKVAVSLATCPEKRADLCRRIGERSHVLFENPDDVRSLEEFLRSIRR
jgi:predicted O-linked N-acetylglucosamine transferase (SPINDLY family)